MCTCVGGGGPKITLDDKKPPKLPPNHATYSADTYLHYNHIPPLSRAYRILALSTCKYAGENTKYYFMVISSWPFFCGVLGAVLGGRLRGAGGGALLFFTSVKFSADEWEILFAGGSSFPCSSAAASRRSSTEWNGFCAQEASSIKSKCKAYEYATTLCMLHVNFYRSLAPLS